MHKLFESYDKFDAFIRMQFLVLFVINFSWALIIPIVTKLQGMLWATSLISGLLILHRLSTFLMPLLKKVTLKGTYKVLIWMDFLYLVGIPLYFVSPMGFLYTEALIMVFYGLYVNMLGINYNVFLMEKYQAEIFKEVQVVSAMIMSVAGIVGFVIVALIDIISSSIETSLYFFMALLTINLMFQLYNYKYYWKDIA